MGVKVRQRKDRPGYWVYINYNKQRTKKQFSDKKLAQEFAKKIEARLKWSEANGEPVVLSPALQPAYYADGEKLLRRLAEYLCRGSL